MALLAELETTTRPMYWGTDDRPVTPRNLDFGVKGKGSGKTSIERGAKEYAHQGRSVGQERMRIREQCGRLFGGGDVTSRREGKKSPRMGKKTLQADQALPGSSDKDRSTWETPPKKYGSRSPKKCR